MRNNLLLVAVVFGLFGLNAKAVFAQAFGEIVVPTQQVFTVNTTVSVPDRGYTSLGGFRSASSTRTETWPGLGRSARETRTASDAGVRVWIHDFSELEEQMASSRGKASGPSDRDFASGIRQYSSAPVAQGNSDRKASAGGSDPTGTAPAKELQAADYVKRGREAESRGKFKVARIYYQSASSLGSAPSAREAQLLLRSVETQIAGR